MKNLILVLIFLAGFGVTMTLNTNNVDDIIQNIISTSATLLGFTLTALAIMVSMPDQKMLAKLKESGHYQELVGRMMSAIAMLMVALIVSLTSSYILALLPHPQYGLAFITGVFLVALCQVIMAVKDFRMLIVFLHE